jgi:hypothetical protein
MVGFTLFDTSMSRRKFPRPGTASRAAAALCTVLVAGAVAVTPAIGQPPAASAPAALYRVFLQDGGVLVSYGEFARVSDRVVLSIPIGGTEASPVLHVISIAEKDVDWQRTNAYAQAARARHYAGTQGESDFARLTREVADTLYQVGATDDPAKRLAIAEAARRQLVDWPQTHFGYRAKELQQMTTWLDQVVSELRVAAGLSSFDLALVANVVVPPASTSAVLPAPTFRERLESGFTAAKLTSDTPQRVSLLRSILDVLAPTAGPGFANSWMADLHSRVEADLAVEVGHDRNYGQLRARALARAAVFERRADVRSLESVVRWVLDEDRRLQQARPADVAALLATLDVKLDAARRLRLAQDASALRWDVLTQYWREVRTGLDRLLGVREWLTAVRHLDGPSPGALRQLSQLVTAAHRELGAVQPPPEVAAAHSTLVAAAGMAVRASTTRFDAVRSGSMDTAWQAASAAAGALMLLDQSTLELRRITRSSQPPPR